MTDEQSDRLERLEQKIDEIRDRIAFEASTKVLIALIIIAVVGNIWGQYLYASYYKNQSSPFVSLVITTVIVAVIVIILRRSN
jgi:drug/metabolite transporter (DMT)-like permease